MLFALSILALHSCVAPGRFSFGCARGCWKPAGRRFVSVCLPCKTGTWSGGKWCWLHIEFQETQKCHQLPSQLVPASSTTSGVCCCSCCCCPAKCASASKNHHTSEPQVTSAVIYTCFIFCSIVIEMLIYEHMRAVKSITWITVNDGNSGLPTLPLSVFFSRASAVWTGIRVCAQLCLWTADVRRWVNTTAGSDAEWWGSVSGRSCLHSCRPAFYFSI